MRTRYTARERMVGAFILLTLLILLGTLAFVGRGKHWFRKHVPYYVIFKEGYNLDSGAKVKLLRTDIGQVTDVELTEENLVKVSLRVLADYASRIRLNASAVVESPTFIGSEYIAITPGTPEAPVIDPGGRIPSREQKKISDYLEEFEAEKKLQRFDEILTNLASLTGQLQDPEGPLFRTLASLQRLAETIEAGEGTVGRLVKSEELYNQTKANMDQVGQILASVQEMANRGVRAGSNVDQMTRDLAANTEQVSEILARVQEILARLEKVSADLEEALAEVPEISRDTRAGIREVNRILDSIKKNILIRGHLPSGPEAESVGVEIRGD